MSEEAKDGGDARWARVLLWLLPSGFLVLVIATRLLVTSDFVTRELAIRISGELANRMRAAVQLSGMSFRWNFAPCFHDLQINRYHGPFKVKIETKQACVDRWASALGSGFLAVRLNLEQPSIALEGNPEGRDDNTPVARAGTRTSTAAATRAPKAALREVEIVFDDLRLEWAAMPLPERFASGTFGPIDGRVTMQLRGRESAMSLALREPKTGSRINGRATPTAAGWDLSAGVEGDLVPIFESFLEDSPIDIRSMPSRGTIGARYQSKPRQLTVDLDLEQYDVDLANRLVSAKRLVGFSARERARIHADLEEPRVTMEEGQFEVNGVPLYVSLALFRGEGSPAFATRVDLRTTPFLRLLRSVPGTDEPALGEVSPELAFALSFSMKGELERPDTWTPQLEYRFQGLDRAEVKTGLEYLRGPFEYFPLTEDGRRETPLVVGPGTPSWVPYKRIPYIQRRAIIVSEDSTFPFHHGVEIEEIRASIRQSIESGERSRGGSTLTQQLAKNLFLSRDRTALRKLQELLLAFHLEAVVGKDDLFEIYANVIEWGPDLYGLQAAAAHYFGRPPEQLSPREMVYLATIIPNPVVFYRHFEKGAVSPKHNVKVNALLERLNRLGQLTDAQLAEAKEAKVRFTRRRRDEP